MIDYKICEKCGAFPRYITPIFPWVCQLYDETGQHPMLHERDNPPARCYKIFEQAVANTIKKS